MLKKILTLVIIISIAIFFVPIYSAFAAPPTPDAPPANTDSSTSDAPPANKAPSTTDGTGASSVENARKGVVMVYCENAKDPKNSSMGSGFVIGKLGSKSKYVVTSLHVISSNTSGVSVVISRDVLIKAKPIITSVSGDYAVLELEKELNDRNPLPLELGKNVAIAQKIYALGFPGAAAAIEDKNTWAPEDVTVSSGIISKEITVDSVSTYQIDASLNPGNSGGPVITEDGAVIGIARFTTKDATNINGAININEIVSSLDSLNIPYELYGVKSTEKASDNKSVTTDTKPSTMEASLPQAQTKTDDTSGKLINYNWMYIIIALIVLVFIVIIVVMILSQRKTGTSVMSGKPVMSGTPVMPYNHQRIHQDNSEVQQVTVAQIQPKKELSIYCTSGYYSNKSFSIGNGKLTMGRDFNLCNIIFPSETPGISSVHCEISRNSSMNKCMLMDKGSTYGTYLSNGERLIKGKVYYLSPYDSFYLASNENMFQIRES